MPFHKASFALLLVSSAPVYAQTLVAPAIEPAATDNPETLVVTASRVAETVGQSLAPITVISHEELARLQPREFQDLLVGLPGVSIANNGGPGKATSLFLRGTESDHVLVLIDGIRMGSVTSGGTAFEQIPVELIERIEIVRGPRSSLYGSEALGGVLQIFTRRGSAGEGLQPSFAIGGGNLGSGRAEAGLRGGFGSGGWFSLGASGDTSDGINAQPVAEEPDHDGFRRASASLAAGWTFAGGAELSANWLRSDARNEYDGSFQNKADETQQLFGGHARFTPLQPWTVTLSGGQSQDLADNFLGSERTGNFDSKRDSYSWQNDVQIARDQTLTAGVDYQRDHVQSSTVYDETSRDDTGAFAQYLGRFGGHELQASYRHDDNQQFGNHGTGAAAYGYRFDGGLRLGASYGTAFKAPTFNELYFPDYGSADLGPEKSRSAEIFVGGTHPLAATTLNWRLNGFRTEIDDLIGSVLVDPDTYSYRAKNLGDARIFGVEAQLGAQHAAWRLQGYYTWLDAENRSGGEDDGKELPRRARNSGRVDLDYDFRRTSVGATVFASGKRYDDVANATRLGGYTTLDLRAGLRLRPNWLLQLKAANLLDAQYQTANTYAQPGMTWFVTLRYAPAI